MKKLVSLALVFVMLFSMSTSVFANANNDKREEFNELVNWAQSQGFEIKGDMSSVNFDEVDIDELRNQLIAISSMGNYIQIDDEKEPVNVEKASVKKSNYIGTRSVDEKTIPMLVKKKYSGTKTVDGRNYNYAVYIYVDYECLLNSNNEPIGIDSINSITSDAGDASFIRGYTHDTGTEVSSISGSKATVRGQGVFDLGIGDFAFTWRVRWKSSFRAGEGDQI